MPLLEIEDLKVAFHTRNGIVRAVDGVSLHVNESETVGIVGESGCGKTVTAYSILGLVPSPPGRVSATRIALDNENLFEATPSQLRAVRGKRASMVFQDPMTALNPYMKVGKQIGEPLRVHEGLDRGTIRDKAAAMLEAVGIQDAARRMHDYPHQFSGGMRQRVMVAMALITRPQLLIADEPTTALDVTVQAQILDLIKTMQHEMGMAMLLITHDLGIVAGVCDRVLVMYAGRIVEAARTDALFASPMHPYTMALMASLPAVHDKGAPLYSIPGMPPDLAKPIQGCPFAPRCVHAQQKCIDWTVELKEVAPGHSTACLRKQLGEI